jgi:Bacterial membrane protein YfhO
VRTWLWDALAITALAVLPAFFLKVLPGGLPPYGGDVLVHVYPLLSLLARGLHAGRPVLWNFYAAGGYPLAPYSALALYPPVAIALLMLSVTGAIAALYAFYLAVLGIGTYLLAAELGLSRPARLLASVTLAYSGFVAAHTYAGHLFELGAVCPLPLAFLLLRRAIRYGSYANALGCGAVVGLMVLAAGVQFLPFALAPLPALALWHTASGLRTRGATLWRHIWPLASLALAGLVAAALAAVFLLPFREILGATLRAGPVPYQDAVVQSLPWGGLAMLVAPDAFGNAAAATYWPASRFGPYFHEIYAYVGLLPLLLAPVALLRCRVARPYGLLALLALLVMLGGNTPLYRLLYALPGGELLRAPARAGLVLDFALALLAAFGLDALRGAASNAARRRRRLAGLLAPGTIVALATIVGLVIAARAGHILPATGRGLALAAAIRLAALLALGVGACIAARNRRLAFLLPALALLDLFGANGALLRPTDPARYFSHVYVAMLRALPPDALRYRVLARDNTVPPGLGMITRRVYDVQDAAPLALADYWRLSHPSLVKRAGGGVVATGRDVIHDVDPFFLRLFGVRTVLSTVPLHSRALRPSGTVTSMRWSVPGGASWNVDVWRATSLIYRDAAALPRFFVVPRAVHTRDAAAALATLQRGAVDPAHAAVLSPAPPVPRGALRALQRSWTSWLGDAKDNHMSVQANGGKRGGYLVIDDGWFPGWTATVDGRETPVLRADYLLRAVRLSPGHHLVHLVYAPLTYLLGATITLATALALLVCAITANVWRLRRRVPAHAVAA